MINVYFRELLKYVETIKQYCPNSDWEFNTSHMGFELKLHITREIYVLKGHDAAILIMSGLLNEDLTITADGMALLEARKPKNPLIKFTTFLEKEKGETNA